MVRNVYLDLQTHIPNYSVAYEELIDRERFYIRLATIVPYCKVSHVVSLGMESTCKLFRLFIESFVGWTVASKGNEPIGFSL